MATYKDDLDILKAAEKDSNKLSLNAITELDNKGLLNRYGGESGGDSPVKVADVRFVTDDTMFSGDLEDVFTDNLVCIYDPGYEELPACVWSRDFNHPIADWNAMMDGGVRLVAPQVFAIAIDSFNVSVVSGSAGIIEIGNISALCITGDCTIQISVKGESSSNHQ